MALKEWYVQLERVKGTNVEYMNYLLDGRRHNGQTITPNGDVIQKLKDLENTREEWHSNMKRGGHIPKASYSLLVSFPFDLNSEQWNDYNRDILYDFFELVLKEQVPNYDEELIESLIDRTIMVTHKSNHTHFMLPKILNEEKVVLDFSKKKFNYGLKKIVNQKLEEKFNISKVDYEIIESKKKQDLSSINIERMENRINTDNQTIIKGEALEEVFEYIENLKKTSERLKANGGDTRIADNNLKKIKELIESGKTIKATRMARSEAKKGLKGQR